MASGAAAFVLATAGLIAVLDTAKPEWRDPEFGFRLRQVEDWKAKSPDRPLVIVLGSSRAQMGISPEAMAISDGPTDPLIYNFGYRGGQPLVAWLNLMRLLDHGIKPRFVLVLLALAECATPQSAERQLGAWSQRLSLADMHRLRPYTENGRVFPVRWTETRLPAWTRYAESIKSDLCPDWQSWGVRQSHAWEFMDRHGFVRYPVERMKAKGREELLRGALQLHSRSIAGLPISEITRQLHADLVRRSRAEGIVPAFAWAPESPRYWAAYGKGRETVDEYTRFIVEELQVDVFPSPSQLEETDFEDGYHLLPAGAAKYSRWLADTHLKPWIVREGVRR